MTPVTNTLFTTVSARPPPFFQARLLMCSQHSPGRSLSSCCSSQRLPYPPLHTITQLGPPPGLAAASAPHCNKKVFYMLIDRQQQTMKGSVLNSAE